MIKSTGIIRRVDELGRVVIPKEIRDQFGIVEKDPIEIFVKNNSIIFKKYQPNCIFCDSENDIQQYNDKLICSKCIAEISNLNNGGKKNGKIVL